MNASTVRIPAGLEEGIIAQFQKSALVHGCNIQIRFPTSAHYGIYDCLVEEVQKGVQCGHCFHIFTPLHHARYYLDRMRYCYVLHLQNTLLKPQLEFDQCSVFPIIAFNLLVGLVLEMDAKNFCLFCFYLLYGSYGFQEAF